jgi:predicted TIM-barrel fold metal-dependent hydrolase
MRLLVDAHTHFSSWSFFEALARASPLSGSIDERIAHVALQSGLEPPARSNEAHLARWMAELDRHRVAHAVAIASAPEEAEDVAWAARSERARLTGLAVLDPRGPLAVRCVERWLGELGLRGLVLLPGLHRYRVDEPAARPALERAAGLGAILVVHCGLLRVPLRERFGLERVHDVTLANPLHVIPLALALPSASFVLPHFGGGFLREALMAGAQCANVYLDTSSSNAWMATQPEKLGLADVFERALSVFGPERILFGTDSSTFPRGWRADLFVAQREALGHLGVCEADRGRIFGGNAEELLALPAEATL